MVLVEMWQRRVLGCNACALSILAALASTSMAATLGQGLLRQNCLKLLPGDINRWLLQALAAALPKAIFLELHSDWEGCPPTLAARAASKETSSIPEVRLVQAMKTAGGSAHGESTAYNNFSTHLRIPVYSPPLPSPIAQAIALS